MEVEKKFCQKCGQRLYDGWLLKKATPMFEFEDGYYCEKCGKIKVEEARAKK